MTRNSCSASAGWVAGGTPHRFWWLDPRGTALRDPEAAARPEWGKRGGCGGVASPDPGCRRRLMRLAAPAYLAAALAPGAAVAAELHVPGGFPTVAAALDAAAPGDEVVLA